MKSIAAELYSAAQVRELDRRAIELCGIPGYTLMQRAAAAAWVALRARWPAAQRIAVVCGSGNNGGDGYGIARLAQAAGRRVRVFELDEAARRGDAATARAAWLAQGTIEAFDAEALLTRDVVVDAIFGIGLSRAPQGLAKTAIAAINTARGAGAGVLAVDIPSGLHADTGALPGVAVEADLTVSFIGRKLGLHTGQGPACTGQLVYDRLAVPDSVYEDLPPLATLIEREELRRWLPPRRRSAHKGDHGHVLLGGGDPGMTGASLFAARAALRAGAGYVSVATRAAPVGALVAAQPEIMFHGVESEAELRALFGRAEVVAIGPGLGTGDWGRRALDATLSLNRPLVLDADALNLIAGRDLRRDDWLLTPHPGEAGRLLGIATAAVNADRAAAAQALRARYGGVAVLKGAGSLVCGERLRVCAYGNPGMAVGGMGDALTGIAAAFVAQGLALETAAAAAVTAHALAGDLAAQRGGERGLAPSDLIEALREIVNP
ncbi:MAG: bifunctional ADP-dependent NAD(P)H-hydrate dehydratase/NAD(P)H-hydrate epimerase [Nevskia sp.]